MGVSTNRLLVQIASYNTNLQGNESLPQDLVDWLSPTLQVSTFLSRERRAPDIVAVGFQELLPLQLGLSGFSKAVLRNRDAHIKREIEANAPNKEAFSLIAKVVNGGVALLVYARDDSVARSVCDVETQWTGSGPAYMGNKGAVGVRFRVPDEDGGVGETFTFVCAHLTAHAHLLDRRIWDYHHIVGTLLFQPLPGSEELSTLYDTSHLFYLGDLNFRVTLPPDHPMNSLENTTLAHSLELEETRLSLKEHDQLTVEKRKGTICISLREAEFWRFKPTYKYLLGEVDRYHPARKPSWTDRILYTTHTDSPDTPDKSDILSVLYQSIPSYSTSDHKPIISLLLLPEKAPHEQHRTVPPLLRLPPDYRPLKDNRYFIKKCLGRSLDRIVGIVWWFVSLLGAGSVVVGLFNCFVGVGAWRWFDWWRSSMPPPAASV